MAQFLIHIFTEAREQLSTVNERINLLTEKIFAMLVQMFKSASIQQRAPSDSPLTSHLLQKWFDLAILAPSGGNQQPWSYSGFELKKDTFKIILKLDPDYLKNPSSLDPNCFVAAIAIGAFAENLEVAAREDGFTLSEFEHRGTGPKEWEWRLLFEKTNFTPHPSDDVEAIKNRITNRFDFLTTPMTTSEWEQILGLVRENSNLKIHRIEPHQKSHLIQTLRILENIRCTNSRFRSDMFTEFLTDQDLKSKSTGLPLNTLTDSVFEKALLKQLKNRPWLQKGLGLGLQSLFINSSVTKPIMKSGDVFVFQSMNTQPESGFEMGKMLEKIWLRWTSLGYSVQILALPLMINTSEDSSIHSPDLKKAEEIARKNLELDFRQPSLIIRVGQATKPSAPSPRRPQR